MSHLFVGVYLCCVLSLTVFSQDIGDSKGCPNIDGLQGLCVFDPDKNCVRQDQCPEEYRCCSFGCNGVCYAVADIWQHPGSCLVQLTNSGIACRKDAVCKPNEKCCYGHCIEVRPLVTYLVGRGPM